nr:putative ribonuclease h protein [Quercus suber]
MPLLEAIAIPLIVLIENGFGTLTRCLKSKHLSGNASFIVYQWERSFKREKLWLHKNDVAFKENRPNQNLCKGIIQANCEYMFCASKADRRLINKVVQVRQNRPSAGWYKLNSNGLSLGNRVRASGGGLICDSNGVWIKGFTHNIGISSSVEAEL